MTYRIDPETAPNTLAIIEESFRSVYQEASGLGDNLDVSINHAALMEAAADSGFGPDNTLCVAFEAPGRLPTIAMAIKNNPANLLSCIIDDKYLGNERTAQDALQIGIITSLAKLSQRVHGTQPQALLEKSKSPRLERIKRQATIAGGVALVSGASLAAIETTASGSPQLIKFGSAYLIGKLTLDELRKHVKPVVKQEHGLIRGYPPFIDFNIKSQQK